MPRLSRAALSLCLMSLIGFAREATIEWKTLADAQDYEVEIGRNARLLPLLKRERLKPNKLVIKLDPGTYYFRLRGFDSAGLPGPWSPVQGFVVNPQPPMPLKPASTAHFKKLDSAQEGILFQWTQGLAGSRYDFEIRDESGPVLKRSLDTPSVYWMPSKAGAYTWHVGFESAGGSEYSADRRFSVAPEALPVRTQVISVRDEDYNCRNIRWDRFRLDGVVLLQNPNRQYTGELGWTPFCRLSSDFDLRALLSSAIYRGDDRKLKPTVETALLLSFSPAGLQPLSLDAGVGLQSWIAYDRFYPSLRAELNYKIRYYIDRVVAGYSLMPAPRGTHHFFRLGLGFNFSGADQERIER